VSDKCLATPGQISGLVTSNAPVYQSGPPTLKSGYLTYDIAGLHYQPDGSTLNIGTYDLVLSSTAARCLYGFSKAPVSATVQVFNESGTEVTAVTTVGENDGWLKLSATGFTFSQKKVKVAVSQPLKLTLTKFSGTSVKPTSQQINSIRAAVKNRVAGDVVTCTAYYKTTSQKAIATKRATNACLTVRGANKGLKVSIKAVKTTASSMLSKVLLTSIG
jgi:hypothetical protein